MPDQVRHDGVGLCAIPTTNRHPALDAGSIWRHGAKEDGCRDAPDHDFDDARPVHPLQIKQLFGFHMPYISGSIYSAALRAPSIRAQSFCGVTGMSTVFMP